jgi:Uma2 family endonuclease
MSVALHDPITLEAFLRWEERQPTRFEFDGLRPVAMTGGTVAHNRIMRRLHRLVERLLADSPCGVFGPDVTIIVDGKARYQDAVVSCAPQSDESQMIEQPIIVFEVLSDSTAPIDRVKKVQDYGPTSSIQRYVVLEQAEAEATVFARRGEDWSASTVANGAVHVPEIGIELDLHDIYPG